jgi:hypothetical protein
MLFMVQAAVGPLTENREAGSWLFRPGPGGTAAAAPAERPAGSRRRRGAARTERQVTSKRVPSGVGRSLRAIAVRRLKNLAMAGPNALSC